MPDGDDPAWRREDPAPAFATSPGPDDEPALAGFVHDVDFTRFDTRLGRLVPLALAGIVAVIAAKLGISAAIGAAVGFGIVLAVVVVLIERERWHAQDVFAWYQQARADRWLRDTGGFGPAGDPASAEVWLGAHRPGSVPQVYRALAAHYAGDPVVIRREFAAMPDATPLDLAWRAWFVEATRLTATGTADPAELARLVGDLPASTERRLFESWLAMVEAARRRLAGDRRWIVPLAAARSGAERVPLPFRRRTRLWLSRFAALIMFAVPAVLLSSFALAIAGQGEPIPPEYARTTYAIRGDLPQFDDQAVARTLPALARSLASATRSVPEALDNETFNGLVDASVPTLIWTTGEIELDQPADLPGRRIWSIEVLLGGLGQASSTAIVIVDDEDGPAYLYRIDPAVLRDLRKAAGLPESSPAP